MISGAVHPPSGYCSENRLERGGVAGSRQRAGRGQVRRGAVAGSCVRTADTHTDTDGDHRRVC